MMIRPGYPHAANAARESLLSTRGLEEKAAGLRVEGRRIAPERDLF
jgi:hypothetical protein